VEKIKTHILCLISFFRNSCHLWDNVEKYYRVGEARDDNMAHALCVLDKQVYRHTLRIYNTHCFSTATMVSWKRLNVTLYLRCPSCLFVRSLFFIVRMTPELFEWLQVTMSSRYLVLFYFRLMICIWAIHQKDQECVKLNHWSRFCPAKWRVSHLLNNFPNFTQIKVKCPV